MSPGLRLINLKIEKLLPENQLRSFKGAYLETAKRLKNQQTKEDDKADPQVQQLDFEFVLFASTLVDYDYIMALIARYTQDKPAKEKMTKEQVINVLSSSANTMDERDDIVDYINTLEVGKGRSVDEIKDGYVNFKKEKSANELADIAEKNGFEGCGSMGIRHLSAMSATEHSSLRVTAACHRAQRRWRPKVGYGHDSDHRPTVPQPAHNLQHRRPEPGRVWLDPDGPVHGRLRRGAGHQPGGHRDLVKPDPGPEQRHQPDRGRRQSCHPDRSGGLCRWCLDHRR